LGEKKKEGAGESSLMQEEGLDTLAEKSAQGKQQSTTGEKKTGNSGSQEK